MGCGAEKPQITALVATQQLQMNVLYNIRYIDISVINFLVKERQTVRCLLALTDVFLLKIN